MNHKTTIIMAPSRFEKQVLKTDYGALKGNDNFLSNKLTMGIVYNFKIWVLIARDFPADMCLCIIYQCYLYFK